MDNVFTPPLSVMCRVSCVGCQVLYAIEEKREDEGERREGRDGNHSDAAGPWHVERGGREWERTGESGKLHKRG